MRLNVARTLRRSVVNGPGERFVLWVQGCPLGCLGCWNPDTWAFERRHVREIVDLASEILDVEGIEGVTFTGGEPFAQARALAALGVVLRAHGLSVFVFTGYELEELVAPAHAALLAVADVVVAGRFVQSERQDGLTWRGSTNQRIHFLSDRYQTDQYVAVPEAEFHIADDGSMAVSGFPPDRLLPLGSGLGPQ